MDGTIEQSEAHALACRRLRDAVKMAYGLPRNRRGNLCKCAKYELERACQDFFAVVGVSTDALRMAFFIVTGEMRATQA